MRSLAPLVFAIVAAPALALTLKPGDIVIALYSNDTVIRVDPGSGVADLLSPASPQDFIQDIAFEPGGDLVCIVNHGGASVVRIDPSTGARTTLASGGLLATGLGYAITTAPDGRIFILHRQDTGGGTIYKVSPAGGAPTPVSTGALLDNADSIAFDASTDTILTAGSTQIVRVNTASGAQTLIATYPAVFFAHDIVIAGDGSLLVAPDAPYILRIDPATGQHSHFIDTSPQVAPILVAVALEPSGAVLVGALQQLDPPAVYRFLSGGGTDFMRAFNADFTQQFNGTLAVYNPPPCPSDVNGNGVVDFGDLNRLLSDYGESCP